MRRVREFRTVKIVGVVVAIVFLVYSIRNAIVEIHVARPTIAWTPLVASTVLLIATYALTVGLWRRMLLDLGTAIRYRDALQVWSLSNLARYIPGKVWQFVGAIAVAKQFGVSAIATSTVSLTAMGLAIGTGSIVGGVLIVGSEHFRTTSILALAAGIAVLAVTIFAPRIVARIFPPAGEGEAAGSLQSVPRRTLVRWALAFGGVWVAQGGAFLLFASGFGPIPITEFVPTVGVFALSYVVGLLAFFSPGGVGVRESVLGSLLVLVSGEGRATHFIALGARLWTVVAEIVLLLIAIAIRSSKSGRRPACESSG